MLSAGRPECRKAAVSIFMADSDQVRGGAVALWEYVTPFRGG